MSSCGWRVSSIPGLSLVPVLCRSRPPPGCGIATGSLSSGYLPFISLHCFKASSRISISREDARVMTFLCTGRWLCCGSSCDRSVPRWLDVVHGLRGKAVELGIVHCSLSSVGKGLGTASGGCVRSPHCGGENARCHVRAAVSSRRVCPTLSPALFCHGTKIAGDYQFPVKKRQRLLREVRTCRGRSYGRAHAVDGRSFHRPDDLRTIRPWERQSSP